MTTLRPIPASALLGALLAAPLSAMADRSMELSLDAVIARHSTLVSTPAFDAPRALDGLVNTPHVFVAPTDAYEFLQFPIAAGTWTPPPSIGGATVAQ